MFSHSTSGCENLAKANFGCRTRRGGQACRANVNLVLRHPSIGDDMEYTPTAMSLLLLPTSIRNVQNCSARQTQISRPTGSSVLSGTRVPCNKFGFPVRIRIILTVLRTDRVAAVIGDVDVYVDVLAEYWWLMGCHLIRTCYSVFYGPLEYDRTCHIMLAASAAATCGCPPMEG